jgi:cytoskeletal protein RodZ
MPFQTKKINSETLSEYLVGVRSHQNFSMQYVSEATGIPMKFLEYLESGKLQALPPTVYVCGFLKKIADLYDISENDLVEQFKKERNLSQEISRHKQPQISKARRWLNKIVVTPKLLSVGAGILFVLVTVGYIIFEVTSIYGTPKLVIEQPKNDQKITGSAVTVSGLTEPGVSLTINGQLIMVDAKTGKFNAVVSVNPGQKDLSVIAANKFGKSNNKKVSVLVDAPVVENQTEKKSEEQLKLTLNFSGSANIMFTADENNSVTESYATGSSKVITANKKILLSTSNAGATSVELNGKTLGPLGKKNETLTDVPFSLEMVSTLASPAESSVGKNPSSN